MNRETIEAAVFTFFAGLAGTQANGKLFRTATRKLKHWEDVQSEDTPALFMRAKSMRAEKRRGLPARWMLNYELFLYVSHDQQMYPDVLPSQQLNPLLDAIDNSLVADDISDDALTLGGTVSHCAINGEIEIYEGSLGNEAVCIVPIEVFVDGN